MVGGTIFHREMIQREISRALVLNLSGKASGAQTLHRTTMPLTEPSLLSRGTLGSFYSCLFTPEDTNQCFKGTPPPPRSFGIMGLDGKSRKIFEFKGLICKIFRNKDLACQRALKMGLGQLRGPPWETDTTLHCPNQNSIVASGGLEVCDDAHRLGVMKKVKG